MGGGGGGGGGAYCVIGDHHPNNPSPLQTDANKVLQFCSWYLLLLAPRRQLENEVYPNGRSAGAPSQHSPSLINICRLACQGRLIKGKRNNTKQYLPSLLPPPSTSCFKYFRYFLVSLPPQFLHGGPVTNSYFLNILHLSVSWDDQTSPANYQNYN